MSALQQVPRLTGRDIYLKAAGKRIAAVGSCEIQARREGIPLIPFGAPEGTAATLGPMQYRSRSPGSHQREKKLISSH